MFINKLQFLLLRTASLDQSPDGLQPKRIVGQGDFAGLVDAGAVVPVGKTQQPYKNAYPLDTSCLKHGLGPLVCMRSDQRSLLKQPDRAFFNRGPLVRMDVLLQGLKLTGFNLDMNDDLLHPGIENPNQMPVPACPDFPSSIFRRNRIVSLLYFNMTIAMDGTFGLLEAWEPAGGKRQQTGFFFFPEQLADLFTRRAVNPRVGYVCLPVEQMLVLLLQTTERAALESVTFYIPNTSFNFALVTRRIGL